MEWKKLPIVVRLVALFPFSVLLPWIILHLYQHGTTFGRGEILDPRTWVTALGFALIICWNYWYSRRKN